MSRYIDYDALDYKNWHMIGKSSDFIDGVVYMAERIEEAPSIDVVRCKECKYYDKFPTWSACAYWSGDPYEQASVNADDFCSYGEVRDEGSRR